MSKKIPIEKCSSTVITRRGIKINAEIKAGACFRIGEIAYIIVYVHDDTIVCTPMGVFADELQRLKFEMCATSDQDDVLSCTNVEQVCDDFIKRNLNGTNLLFANSTYNVCGTLMDNIPQYFDGDGVLAKIEDASMIFDNYSTTDTRTLQSVNIIEWVAGIERSESDGGYNVDVIGWYGDGLFPISRKRISVDPTTDKKMLDVYVRPYLMLSTSMFVEGDLISAIYSSINIGQKTFSIGDAIWIPWDAKKEKFILAPTLDAISQHQRGPSSMVPKCAFIEGIRAKINSKGFNATLMLNCPTRLGCSRTSIDMNNQKMDYFVAFHDRQDCEDYCNTIAKTARVKREDLELLDKDALVWIASHPEYIED